MYQPPFSTNNSLREQNYLKGKSLYSGTYGSNNVGYINSNPKDQWTRNLAKQPDVSAFAQQGLSTDVANQQLGKIQKLDVLPNFSDENSQNASTVFLSKYMIDNGLVPQDQKVFSANLGVIQAQQPGSLNPRGTLGAPNMKFPGSGGVSVG